MGSNLKMGGFASFSLGGLTKYFKDYNESSHQGINRKKPVKSTKKLRNEKRRKINSSKCGKRE
jgi:hypothetical protein